MADTRRERQIASCWKLSQKYCKEQYLKRDGAAYAISDRADRRAPKVEHSADSLRRGNQSDPFNRKSGAQSRAPKRSESPHYAQ
jgi:hypothetical protein